MSLHIVNFNFQFCSVPEIYTTPPHNVFIHIRNCSTCHKINKRGNILKYFLSVSDETVFEISTLYNIPHLRYRPTTSKMKQLLVQPYKITCQRLTFLHVSKLRYRAHAPTVETSHTFH